MWAPPKLGARGKQVFKPIKHPWYAPDSSFFNPPQAHLVSEMLDVPKALHPKLQETRSLEPVQEFVPL